jgi:hypothetical protein
VKPTKPEDLFRAEKERALTVRNSQHARLLAEAKAAFDKLMAEGQAARKSGRPRKHPLPPLKTSSARPQPTPAKPMAATMPAPVAKPAPAATPAPAAKSAKPAVASKKTPAKKAAKPKAAAKPKTKAKSTKR